MNAREELSRYRKALVSSSAVVAAGACPDPERIWEAARGESPPREVTELVDHTLACSDCSLAWQLAVELGRLPEQPARILRSPRFLRHRQLWSGVLAAAAAILLVVTVPWQDFGGGPPSGVRGGELPGSDEIVSLVPADEPLSRQDCVLRWSSPWADARYSVTVVDDEFKPLTEIFDLEDPQYRVPEEELTEVAPGALLYWTVRATGPERVSLDGGPFQLVLN